MIRGLVTEAKAYKPFDPKTSKGLYLSVVPNAEGQDLIRRWGDILGLGMTDFDVSELHVTVVYSKVIPEGVGNYSVDTFRTYKAQAQGIEWWPGHDDSGYCVLRLQCPALADLHKQWLTLGCTRTFGHYLPHMTIKKDVGEMPADFHVKRARLNRELGTFLTLGNAHIEGLKK